MEIKISIIVPVYKAEKTLEACVRSALSQDFSEFELILVDDGSPDGSGGLCAALAKTDARISVFHKPNGGCNSARKLGVENARGDWIMFLDSDDVLLPGCIASLCACAAEFPDADIVEGRVLREGQKSGKFGKRRRRFSCDRVCYADGLRESSRTAWNTFFCAPFAKLIRRSLFSEATFRIPQWVKTGEDNLMLLILASRVRRAVKMNRPVYVYKDNEEGLCATNPETTDYIFRRLLLMKEIIFSGFDGAAAEIVWSGTLQRTFFRLVMKREREDPQALKLMAEEVKKLKRPDWKSRLSLKILSVPEESAFRKKLLRFLFKRLYRLSRIFG